MSLKTNKDLPIGIFDSGMGGLTVLRALKQCLPNEHFVYLGDTARLPYGTKSAETVKSYALNANAHLVDIGIKALVVACNTASSMALSTVRAAYPELPIIGVIAPGVTAALEKAHKKGPIVVLATEGTVQSQAYSKALSQQAPDRQIIEWPCPLLVAMAEEGWNTGDLVEQLIQRILTPLHEKISEKPAGYLLGCTHFPVFQAALESVIGQESPVINPAQSVAALLKEKLDELQLLNPATHEGHCRFMATDGIPRFVRVAPRFLGEAILTENVSLVTVAVTALNAIDNPFVQNAWDNPC